MKNPYVESLKRRAKQYHRTRRGDYFDGGIKSIHLYDGLPSDRLSWWDDVTFIMNDYRVALAWHHPRMAFENAIDDEAQRLAADIPFDDFLHEGEPVYKTIGKSRKKISYTTYKSSKQSNGYEQWKEIRRQVMQSVNVDIAPSLKSNWCRFSRIAYLCVPIEVRNKTDLHQLVSMTRRLLKREVTLSELFPNYQYTRADWEREGLDLINTDLHIHKVGN